MKKSEIKSQTNLRQWNKYNQKETYDLISKDL